VQALGFDGGRVLEPGCGSGNFIGFAPPGARLTGVELDPVTAAIAAALYPRAQVLAGSFAGTRDRDGSYDLVVGNVPFGRVLLHDRTHNPGHSIHNHFIIKSLRLTRPGGVVAVLTSRYTMDARNPAASREIAGLADLTGAIRLPGGAHQRAAGTSVVTDLLILRRREPGRQTDSTAWEQTRTVSLHGHEVPVNEYFLARPDAVLGELGTLVFDDPESGRLLPAAEYLSGNVRARLRAAQAAAEDDPRFAVNAAELRNVIPADLAPGEIDARLGAAWIGPSHVRQFLREILDDDRIQVEHPGGQVWAVRGSGHTVLAASTWGTERYPAPQLAQAILEQRKIEVRDLVQTPDGERSVLNVDATLAAQEKAAELAERFSEWAWEDPARAAGLARAYNEKFNNLVLRSYDDARLSLPGLTVTFRPRQHQVAAVARMIHEPAAGLFHEVGAGKTAEMIMGVTELRRLGLVRKPAVIIPNHMLEQFAREWLQLYPRARVLVAHREDLQGDRRRQFAARCATGDWDGVVMSRSAFERIPLSPDQQRAYMDRELAQMRAWIETARQGERLTVKRLEGALLRAEERLKAKLDSARDPGVTFESTGIDYLCVDEAHGYKNLRTPSNIADAAIDGSMRASDLDMKLDYLRRRNGRRVATFATATPIANSVTEAYVMQRYLRPDLLEAAGISVFDTWAATFGQVVTQVELAPEGGDSFRVKSRFARFRNVPEMLRMTSAPRRPWPSSPPRSSSITSPSCACAPNRSATGPSAPRKTTCSRSPATAGAPRSTCGSSDCPREHRGRSTRLRTASSPSGRPTATMSTGHPTAPLPGPRVAPAGVLRPGHPRRGLERL